jgi:O-antigen/teichoic acid export membrane protein
LNTKVLLGNSGWLFLTSAITSAFGIAYWWVAARYFNPSAVGVGSASISALMLVGTVCTLGFGTLLMGEIQRAPDRARGLTSASLITTALVGLAIGATAAIVLPLVTPNLDVLSSSVLALAVFGLSTGATATAMIADQAAVGFLRSSIQFWRNLIMSIAKLAAVVAGAAFTSRSSGVAVYTAWGVGVASSLVYSVYKLSSVTTEGRAISRSSFRQLAELRYQAAGHYFFNIALQVPSLALPIVCIAVLSPTASGQFYIAWMIALVLYMVPISLTNVLYPLASREPTRLRRAAFTTLAISAGTALAGIVVLALFGRALLGEFGSAYAGASGALLSLGIGAIPMGVKSHYVAVSRVGKKVGRRVPVAWGGAVSEIVVAAGCGYYYGTLEAFAVGWLVAIIGEALVMSPGLLASLKSG